MGYHLYDIRFSSLSEAKHLIIWCRHPLFDDAVRKLSNSLTSDYLCQIFWLLVIYFIKISILFLYLRIFPDIQNFRIYVIGTMVFVTLSVIILVPIVIWQCVPIQAIWDLKRRDARCLSISGAAYANAAVNIATEIAILILPLPLLRHLRASRSKKVALYALFGCGIL